MWLTLKRKKWNFIHFSWDLLWPITTHMLSQSTTLLPSSGEIPTICSNFLKRNDIKNYFIKSLMNSKANSKMSHIWVIYNMTINWPRTSYMTSKNTWDLTSEIRSTMTSKLTLKINLSIIYMSLFHYMTSHMKINYFFSK